jgi:hypothetical protein
VRSPHLNIPVSGGAAASTGATPASTAQGHDPSSRVQVPLDALQTHSPLQQRFPGLHARGFDAHGSPSTGCATQPASSGGAPLSWRPDEPASWVDVVGVVVPPHATTQIRQATAGDDTRMLLSLALPAHQGDRPKAVRGPGRDMRGSTRIKWDGGTSGRPASKLAVRPGSM